MFTRRSPEVGCFGRSCAKGHAGSSTTGEGMSKATVAFATGEMMAEEGGGSLGADPLAKLSYGKAHFFWE